MKVAKIISISLVIWGLFTVITKADMVVVPPDYRANTTEKILALKNYDAVETGPANFDNLYGEVLREDGSPVPQGYRLWFLKESNGAVVGVFDTTDNDPEGFFRVYGEPTVNNSLVVGDVLGVVVQDLSDDMFYMAYFNEAPNITFQDKWGSPAIRADITVTDTVIPEPMTLSLLVLGCFVMLKRRQYQ